MSQWESINQLHGHDEKSTLLSAAFNQQKEDKREEGARDRDRTEPTGWIVWLA